MQMAMNRLPPSIRVQVGAETFELKHRYLNGCERASALELLSSGISALSEFMVSFFIGWVGVEDESGTPIPFQRMGRDGETVSDLNVVMGMIPLSEQLKVLFVQLAMNGVSAKRIADLADLYVDDDDRKRLAQDILPFARKPGGAAGGSSRTSSTTATSPTGAALPGQ